MHFRHILLTSYYFSAYRIYFFRRLGYYKIMSFTTGKKEAYQDKRI